MRPIKFKAKTSDGEWVEGLYSTSTDNGETTHYVGDFNLATPIDPNTLSQFTGLTDKNGKDIYEGDIVKYPNDNRECEVIYRANDYGAGFLTDSHYGIHSLGDVMNTLEVIGNIHDKNTTSEI